MIERMTLGGTPYVGIVAYANDTLAVVRTGLSESNIARIAKALETNVVSTSIARTDLVGIFLAGNSKGIIAPDAIEEHEG